MAHAINVLIVGAQAAVPREWCEVKNDEELTKQQREDAWFEQMERYRERWSIERSVQLRLIFSELNEDFEDIAEYKSDTHDT